MANRSDRPALDDLDGTADIVGHVDQDQGSAGSPEGSPRYKQVRRRAGEAVDEGAASGAVAETNRMKRTRRRPPTPGATTSTGPGKRGSGPSGKTAGAKTAGAKTAAGKPAAAKAAGGKAAAGGAPTVKPASGKTTSGQSRPVAPDTGDAEATSPGTKSKPVTNGSTRRSDVSTKWAVDRLDAREKRISFAAAGAALLFGITIYISETHDKKFHLAKDQLTPEWTLILGIAAAALLLGATFLGRRAPVGFVALFAGAMFTGSSIIFGLPFIAVALWILFRSYKVQKEMSANVRAARAESRSQATSSRSAGASTRGSDATTRGAKGTAKAKGPAMPEGNKRFTPKRPPPPPPKPSRRERKAAQPSD